MGAFDEGTKPGGLTNPDNPILANESPANISDAGSLNQSSPLPGDAKDAGAAPGPMASDLPDPLLGAVISSDHLPALDQVLDQLTTSINLFDVSSLDLDYPGHFDGGSQV